MKSFNYYKINIHAYRIVKLSNKYAFLPAKLLWFKNKPFNPVNDPILDGIVPTHNTEIIKCFVIHIIVDKTDDSQIFRYTQRKYLQHII